MRGDGGASLENVDGKGTFKLHWIKPRKAHDDFHSMQVFDYDNDGDWDIMVGNGPLSPGKRTFILENVAASGKNPAVPVWKEHVILEGIVAHGIDDERTEDDARFCSGRDGDRVGVGG